MANNYIVTETDKFENKTTTTSASYFVLYNVMDPLTKIQANYRHIKSPKVDVLVLDVQYLAREWWFLKDGALIFNVNDEYNIRLEPHNIGTSTMATEYYSVAEGVYYIIDKDFLKRICDANKIDIKIKGKRGEVTISANSFITYSQQFYNNFFDENMYKESLSVNLNKSSGCLSFFVLGIIFLISIVLSLH